MPAGLPARRRGGPALVGPLLAGLLGLGLLGGCGMGPPPSGQEAADLIGAPPAPSPRARALAGYYQRLQRHLLAQGLLRRDGGGPDTGFRSLDLARNFTAIAFYDEHSGGELSQSRAEVSRFHPWRGPVRIAGYFGPSVSAAQRSQDSETLRSYASRLARITAQPITTDAANPNFHVLFMGADDNDALRETVRKVWPDFPASRLDRLTQLPRDIYCLVHTNTPSAAWGRERAIALIRAEHPDLMRLSCIHEELAQGLGLSNDSPFARPSIFNDDEEFATLTSHDELLLKMLYDPRLKSGMSLEAAQPIIRQIAQELAGEIGS
ncbi:DUF2927 domain-containing protein [uncultured Lentibacter sp.]|uniref:DUF2927 domain-containing protein n=1 Tax=uncultured Lentibacter sp. TaxID=1659309 RepID=UPI00261A2E0A|nr:DUF2927 domain-containing protein [uncultured Lentibacter sp.]